MSNDNTPAQQEQIPHNSDLVGLVQKELSRMTQANFARAVGISGATLNQWLQGKYAGNVANVDEKVARYFNDKAHKRTERAAIALEPEFFETSTSQLISSTLEWTQWMGDIGLVYGGAGVGKTRALKQFIKDKNNVWLMECNPTNAQGMAMLRATLKSVRHNLRPGRQSECFSELCEITRGTKGLMIFDEAQYLSPSSLEMLRRLHDLANVGIALVGNEEIYVHVTGGSRRADFAQIFSRIGNKLNLDKVIADDVITMIEAWSARGCINTQGWGASETELLIKIGQSNGALRNVQKVINRAIILAAGEEKPLTQKHLKQAWRTLGGNI